jgi:deoxyribodipyrimidine photo-lyase
LAKLAEPWTMTLEEQRASGCMIGSDYPSPIVDHKAEREHAMVRYRAVSRRG